MNEAEMQTVLYDENGVVQQVILSPTTEGNRAALERQGFGVMLVDPSTLPADWHTMRVISLAKAGAEGRVNAFYNALAREHGQRDAEHASKRALAARAAAGDVDPQFAELAEIEGAEPVALAVAILAKPDEALERGKQRRRLVLAIRAADTIPDIERIELNLRRA